MKPKQAKKRGGGYDNVGTPTYALAPLLPYIDGKVIWESASNEEGLITNALRAFGSQVVDTGLFEGAADVRNLDFLQVYAPFYYDVQVTNPPFSLKYEWLARSYELNKPFALLLPVETVGSGKALRMFDEFGVEIIFMTRRVNFKMPVKGWKCQAQFPTAWFTWKLGIGKEVSIAEIDNKLDPLMPLTEILHKMKGGQDETGRLQLDNEG